MRQAIDEWLLAHGRTAEPRFFGLHRRSRYSAPSEQTLQRANKKDTHPRDVKR
jgi:hypothetical protein